MTGSATLVPLTGRTVAVTGAAGFIGSFVTAALVDSGARVIALDRTPGPRLCLPELGERGTFEFVATPSRWPYEDVGARRSQPGWLTALDQADSLIHLGYAEPPPLDLVGEYRRELVDNVVPTLDLLGRLNDRVATIVLASSSLVYGRGYTGPIAETDPARADSPYGRAKLDLEEALVWWASAEPGRRAVAARIATVYGPTETVPRAAPNFIRRALAGRAPRVAVADDLRDYVYVGDVAAAIVALLATDGTGDSGWSAVNIGTGVATSTLDLARLVVAAVGADLVPDVGAGNRQRVSVVVDPARLAALTGFTAPTPLAEGIEREIDWFRRHPDLWAHTTPGRGAGPARTGEP